MKTIYTPKHHSHAPLHCFTVGKLIETPEKPSRVQNVLEEVKARGLGSVIEPDQFSHEKILRVHSADYVHFLQHAHLEWISSGFEGNAFASVFNNQHPNIRNPKHIEAKLGYYAADTVISFTPKTWDAIESSAFVALTAQKIMQQGDRSAFALCRPPGHHATISVAAGFCYLNNAAIAAQAFLDDGCNSVAILDIDYHHGNGTQSIFYDRSDVLFLSIHADPLHEYPYYTGHADERGSGVGEGFNVNYPLPLGTDFTAWDAALDDSIAKIRNYAPDVLVISLGVDTFKDDPISKFKLESVDYLTIGARLAKLGLPTLFVMEGGYAIEAIGINATNVLSGYLGG